MYIRMHKYVMDNMSWFGLAQSEANIGRLPLKDPLTDISYSFVLIPINHHHILVDLPCLFAFSGVTLIVRILQFWNVTFWLHIQQIGLEF